MTDKPQKKPPRPAPEAAEALLAQLRGHYPKAFASDPEAVMPLALRTHKRLATLGLGDIGLLKAALSLHTSSPAYLKALAEGRPRVDLEGNPAGTVSEAHQAEAAEELAQPGGRRKKLIQRIKLAGQIAKSEQQQKNTMPQIELTAAFAKIAFTIDPETFRAVLDVDSVGAKTVPVAINVDGRKYTANLNPKSFRKAQAAFKEAANPTVSISGNLKGNVVESAGIQIFDKGAKPAAAEQSPEA